MQCGSRPKLVGEPYGRFHPSWALRSDAPGNAFKPTHFDCYSVGLDGPTLTMPREVRAINATTSRTATKITKANTSKVLAMKKYVWSRGFATQSDANFIALEILRSRPSLAAAVASRFPMLLIDECQDMTAVQHGLLDELCSNGLSSVVLIGDEYQAIYEWNTAKPELFAAKRRDLAWNGKVLSRTFRCSPAISRLLTAMAADGTSLLTADDSVNGTYGESVEVCSLGVTTEEFSAGLRSQVDALVKDVGQCNPHDLRLGSRVLVLARSRNHLAELRRAYYGNAARESSSSSLVWRSPLTPDYLRVVHHLSGGNLFEATRRYEAMLLNESSHRTMRTLRSELDMSWRGDEWQPDGAAYRRVIGRDIATLRAAIDGQSDFLVSEAMALFSLDLRAIPASRLSKSRAECADLCRPGPKNGDRPLSAIFAAGDLERNAGPHPSWPSVQMCFSTVHGVKGETYDGVLFALRERTDSCNCPSSSTKWADILDHDIVECELKRILYVGVSRAARKLSIVAPTALADAFMRKMA